LAIPYLAVPLDVAGPCLVVPLDVAGLTCLAVPWVVAVPTYLVVPLVLADPTCLGFPLVGRFMVVTFIQKKDIVVSDLMENLLLSDWFNLSVGFVGLV